MPISFKHPSTILIAGPTGCGKTMFVLRLILDEDCFSEKFDRVLFVYGQKQWTYDFLKLLKEKHPKILPHIVEFKKEFTRKDYDDLDPELNNLVVFDDQMTRMGDSDELAQMFTEGSHHKNTTVVYMVQNLFDQRKAMRTVSLNSHYVILFKNPRDRLQVRSMAMQTNPRNSSLVTDSYEDATNVPYGYFVMDNRAETPDILRYFSKIFSNDDTTIYVPYEYEEEEEEDDKNDRFYDCI